MLALSLIVLLSELRGWIASALVHDEFEYPTTAMAVGLLWTDNQNR